MQNSKKEFSRKGALVKQDDEIYMGKVDMIVGCGGPTRFKVCDVNDELLYELRGKSCQAGLDCHLPCGSCSKVAYTIYNGDGNECGEIRKEWNSCKWKQDRNHFEIILPTKGDWRAKSLLFSAGLMINVLYMEFKQRKP